MLVASADPNAVLGILGFLGFMTFFVPPIMLGVAWDERKRRPIAARKLARLAMLLAPVAGIACLGMPLLAMSGRADPMASGIFLGLFGPIAGLVQATVFSLAWVLSREPRERRRDAVDDA